MRELKAGYSEFVDACADGNLEEVIRLLDEEKVDIHEVCGAYFPDPNLNLAFEDDDSEDEGFEIEIREPVKLLNKSSDDLALGYAYNTTNMTGLGAAMAYHRLDVVIELMKRGADPMKGRQGIDKKSWLTAIDTAASFGFWQGIKELTENWNVPLSNGDRPAGDLLFSAIPSVVSIHSFGPDSDPEDIARAKMLDDKAIKDGLDTFAYLVKDHGLDVRATHHNSGKTILLNVFEGSNGFWGDNYRVKRGLVELGCDPGQESIETDFEGMKIVFAKSAEEDLEELTGDNSFMDYFSEERSAERDLYETTALIDACFKGDFDSVQIYLQNESVDPGYEDRNGNTAFSAVEAGAKYAEDDTAKDNFRKITELLELRTLKKDGPVFVMPSGPNQGPN